MAALPIAIAHLDESCLGNGREGANPGGAAALVETRAGGTLSRRDVYISSADTTNNRMALSGAIAVLQLMSGKGRRIRALLVSDSEYLVRGMREWLPGWISRGWTRKGGAIENLPLWQALVASAADHEVQFTWVRGHNGHPKNEFADYLAVRAAREQITSDGLVPSEFEEWLEKERARNRYSDYDPTAAYSALEGRLAAGERFPLDAGTIQ